MTEPKFKVGDRVRTTKGSEWQGYVVGTYSTQLTPEGYAVESEAHKGSCQIYPASALELVTDAAKAGWVCPQCGTDRLKAACPKGLNAALTGHCPMIGKAQ